MDRLDFSVCLFSKPLSKQLSIVKMTKLPADMYKIGIKWQTMLKALILALTKHCQFKIIKYCSSYLEAKAKQLKIREYRSIYSMYSGIGIKLLLMWTRSLIHPIKIHCWKLKIVTLDSSIELFRMIRNPFSFVLALIIVL